MTLRRQAGTLSGESRMRCALPHVQASRLRFGSLWRRWHKSSQPPFNLQLAHINPLADHGHCPFVAGGRRFCDTYAPGRSSSCCTRGSRSRVQVRGFRWCAVFMVVYGVKESGPSCAETGVSREQQPGAVNTLNSALRAEVWSVCAQSAPVSRRSLLREAILGSPWERYPCRPHRQVVAKLIPLQGWAHTTLF